MHRSSLSCDFGEPLPSISAPVSSLEPSPHFVQVLERAYQLWKQHDFTPGTALDYWCEAEQEFLAEETPDRL